MSLSHDLRRCFFLYIPGQVVFSPDFDRTINRKALRFQFHHPQAAPEPESREALCGGLALSLNWKARGVLRDQLVHFLLGGFFGSQDGGFSG